MAEAEDVEMVAKTLHAHTGRSARDFPWGHIDEVSRDYYRDSARRLLTRLEEARTNRTVRATPVGGDPSFGQKITIRTIRSEETR